MIRDILSKLFLLAIIGAAVFYGKQFYDKKKATDAIVDDLSTKVADSAFYSSFSRDSSEVTICQILALLKELDDVGIPPKKALQRIFGINPEDDKEVPDARQSLTIKHLVSLYSQMIQMGAYERDSSMERLKSGKPSTITHGDNSGMTFAVVQIIPSKLFAGGNVVVPNLELRPRPHAKPRKIDDAMRARILSLASDLRSADVMDRGNFNRIKDAFKDVEGTIHF